MKIQKLKNYTKKINQRKKKNKTIKMIFKFNNNSRLIPINHQTVPNIRSQIILILNMTPKLKLRK